MAAGPAAAPRRRLAILAAGALVGTVILCGLGVWQVQRLAWKEDLIARVETRTVLPPVPAPGPSDWPTLDLDDADYTPVALSGTFAHADEAHAYVALSEPRGPAGGVGYFVLTPLQTTDGWWVIVNRGFVPQDRKDPATRPEGQIEGAVEVTGLLRPPQGRNAFTPADDPEENLWFTRDPAAIAGAAGLPADRVAPYYIDAAFDPDLPGGLPQGGETTLSFSNNHLQYAVTWFGLAAALVAMFLAYARTLLRGASRGR